MKLCKRNYSGESLLTTKKINGVECCPLCEKPAGLHNTGIKDRALAWALGSDTGTSSKTLCRVMLGAPKMNYESAPSDADDRGRCIRLLELIPEWIPRLPELLRDDKPQEGIVINSSGMTTRSNGWADQIPLIIKEGRL
jgi:hypothetical protein